MEKEEGGRTRQRVGSAQEWGGGWDMKWKWMTRGREVGCQAWCAQRQEKSMWLTDSIRWVLSVPLCWWDGARDPIRTKGPHVTQHELKMRKQGPLCDAFPTNLLYVQAGFLSGFNHTFRHRPHRRHRDWANLCTVDCGIMCDESSWWLMTYNWIC